MQEGGAGGGVGSDPASDTASFSILTSQALKGTIRVK